MTIRQLSLAYYPVFAEANPTVFGKPNIRLDELRYALKALTENCGDMKLSAFGPKALAVSRTKMLGRYSKEMVHRFEMALLKMFKWALSQELLTPDRFTAITSLEKIKHEMKPRSERTQPVTQEQFEAVLPFVSPVVNAMLRVQVLTGMRPGELVIMRWCDIDCSGDVWVYYPAEHKTQDMGFTRAVFLSKPAQEIIKRFPRPDPSKWIFAAEYQRGWATWMEKPRTTPMPSRYYAAGSIGRQNPFRTTRKYSDTVSVGCKKAFGKLCWHPHQLRHTFATKIRATHGLEVAQVLLGHATITATQVYAQRNLDAALAAVKGLDVVEKPVYPRMVS